MIKTYFDGKEYLSTEYFVNGKPFSTFGIEVMEKSGLFNILALKERQSISLAGQHGYCLTGADNGMSRARLNLTWHFLTAAVFHVTNYLSFAMSF